jgi:serine/threonine protein kinase
MTNPTDTSIHIRASRPLVSSEEAVSGAVVGSTDEELRSSTVGDYAQKLHEEEFKNSQIPDKSSDLPQFDTQEVLSGKVLGKGAFGMVHEIRGFQIQRTSSTSSSMGVPCDSNHSNPIDVDDEVAPGNVESCKFIAKHCFRNGGDARYAVKRLRPHVIQGKDLLWQGIADLATETRFLSSMAYHPNVIHLRAIGRCRFSEDCFIVLDRLYDTLTIRLQTWRQERKRQKRMVQKYWKDPQRTKKSQLYDDRLLVTYDLSSALAHLHKCHIIHRDLKPDNLGFDIVSNYYIYDGGHFETTLVLIQYFLLFPSN